jgi:hemerythrin-like domain-containing protein
MNAIDLLDQQHDEVEALFDEALAQRNGDLRMSLFEQIADQLAMHTAIEEKVFYRNLFDEETQDLLVEATEEHLAAKRLIADMVDMASDDPHFVAKLTVLKEEVRHHVQEERKEVFPLAKRVLDEDQLEALGQQMEAMVAELREATQPPRFMVPAQTAHAAELR